MWKFQDVLNTDISIMLVMAAGAACVFRSSVFGKEDIRVFNTFLFKLTLPASVIMGLGVKTDLYDGEIWRFVGAFLMMRAIMLGCCALLFGGVLRRSLGEVTANWLSTTWISTVILGTPLLKALLGPQYASLGVVAGISSFIFQLPVMLIMFEVHVWRQENMHAVLPAARQDQEAQARNLALSEQAEAELKQQHMLPGAALPVPPSGDASSRLPTVTGCQTGDSGGATVSRSGKKLGHVGCWQLRMTHSQGKRLGLRLVLNHVLWGVGIGLVLSLSKIGPKWLDPGTLPANPNCSYAVGAGFIFLLLEYFSRCTEPVAFFATGMWMLRRDPIACGWLPAAGYMLVKTVLVPALMVGCCFAVGLEGAMARAAVLVATLPVSAAAFALSKTYNVREDVAVTNVFLGNLLVLPTTIAWLSFMDAVDLFNSPQPKMPNLCASPPTAAG